MSKRVLLITTATASLVAVAPAMAAPGMPYAVQQFPVPAYQQSARAVLPPPPERTFSLESIEDEAQPPRPSPQRQAAAPARIRLPTGVTIDANGVMHFPFETQDPHVIGRLAVRNVGPDRVAEVKPFRPEPALASTDRRQFAAAAMASDIETVSRPPASPRVATTDPAFSSSVSGTPTSILPTSASPAAGMNSMDLVPAPAVASPVERPQASVSAPVATPELESVEIAPRNPPVPLQTATAGSAAAAMSKIDQRNAAWQEESAAPPSGQVDALIEVIAQNPGKAIELRGSASGLGNDALSLKLAEARAIQLRSELMQRGVPAARVTLGKPSVGRDGVAWKIVDSSSRS